MIKLNNQKTYIDDFPENTTLEEKLRTLSEIYAVETNTIPDTVLVNNKQYPEGLKVSDLRIIPVVTVPGNAFCFGVKNVCTQ